MSWKNIIKEDNKEEMFREEYSDEDIEEMYNEALDEMGEVKLGNLTFSPSRIIKESSTLILGALLFFSTIISIGFVALSTPSDTVTYAV